MELAGDLNHAVKTVSWVLLARVKRWRNVCVREFSTSWHLCRPPELRCFRVGKSPIGANHVEYTGEHMPTRAESPLPGNATLAFLSGIKILPQWNQARRGRSHSLPVRRRASVPRWPPRWSTRAPRSGSSIARPGLAEDLAQRLNSVGGRAHAVELDVRSYPSFERAVAEAMQQSGRVDYLFNNAGIGIGGEVDSLTLDDWGDIIDVNLRGVVHGIQAVYPIMIRQHSGHIVNTASMAGLITTSAMPATRPPSTPSSPSPKRCGWRRSATV